MADGKITRDQLADLIQAASSEYEVYGPTAQGDAVEFRRVASGRDLALDYRNSELSPKGLFLARTEVVYEFDGQNVADTLPEQKRLVIGVRPCDCRALTLLDRVFDAEEIKDPFYVTRRQNTVLIALGCDRPLSTCYCAAVGGDPFGQEGADILLGEAGDSFIFKVLTPKGRDFQSRYASFLSDQSGGDWQSQASKAREKIEADLGIKGADKRLRELFDSEIWDAVSRKCLGCGTCSYLCPTCYCFDLTDEKTPGGARKIRRWDCCMFPLFTRHASGHNPRPVNAARLRQKVLHKFSYYPETYGISDCVGCGRCIRSCPVNLDIRQILGELMAAQTAMGK